MLPDSKTRILLNAAPLCTILSGVARYTRSLYTPLKSEQSCDVDYFCNGLLKNNMPSQSGIPIGGNLPSWFREILREIRFKIIGFQLKKIVRKGHYSIYHETGAFPLLINSETPTVMTIYDLSLVKFKHCHPVDRVRIFERHFYKGIDSVAHFITISEYIRQEIIETLNIPPEKVTAIPLGVDKFFQRKSDAEITKYKQEKGLPDQYILTVGTHEPRKNIAMLVRALAKTKEKYTLVSTGWSGWLNTEFHQQVKKLHMEDRVICLDHVPDEELVLLYGGASLMVYPSLYEGFGLPILEAMACGCPVVCSNTSSMPEVAGEAAILVAPDSESAMVEAIENTMSDAAIRQSLVKAGLKQVEKFNWHDTASKTLSLFEKIASGK